MNEFADAADVCPICDGKNGYPSPYCFVPMFEGEIVDTEKTDDWAGFMACESCYEKYMQAESHKRFMELMARP